MNINLLILSLFAILGGIFLLFKPLSISTAQNDKEIPLLEMRDFTLYEFDTNKLVDFSTGKKALKFADRHELYDFSYNDNANGKIVSINAHKGIDKDNTITLEKDVRYMTSEGVEFKTQKAFYDRKKEFARCDTPYVATMQQNVVYGDTLYYDLKHDKLRSTNVRATYHLNGQKR